MIHTIPRVHERLLWTTVVTLSFTTIVHPAAINITLGENIDPTSSSKSSYEPNTLATTTDSKAESPYDQPVKSSASPTNWLVGNVKPKTWMIKQWPASKSSRSSISGPSPFDLQPNLPIYPPYPSTIVDKTAPVDGILEGAQPMEEGGTVQAQIECPEKSGVQAYAHPEECDQFYLCTNGTLTLERCQNGLLFKGGPGAVHNHCHYHWDVDCSARHKDMIALSTESCEYQFGMYPEEVEEGACSNKFVVCEFGRATVSECAPGLAYDPRTHRCNWPDEMADLKCDAKSLLGFECPESIPEDPLSARFWPYPRFALKGDCKRLITCVNGQPRLVTCDDDMVVDDTTLTCEEPELVPHCAHLAKQIEEENVQEK